MQADADAVPKHWHLVLLASQKKPSSIALKLLKCGSLICMAANGYDVDYLRVPVTDEKAPKTSDFAVLAARAWAPPEGAALVYNCQMGRGRTTTGMIIASLIMLRRRLNGFPGTGDRIAQAGRRAMISVYKRPLPALMFLSQGSLGLRYSFSPQTTDRRTALSSSCSCGRLQPMHGIV